MPPPALLQFLRVLPEHADELPRLMAAMDAEALVREATHHGLAAYVLHTLQRWQQVLPSEQALELRKQGVSLGAKVFKLQRLLEACLDVLATAGIVPVLLKGFGVGKRYYPEPYLRPMGDVDILVPRAQLNASVAALQTLGLVSPDAHLEAWARENHHHVLLHGERGTVEVHFHGLTGFGTTLDGEELYARSVEAELSGRRVRYLKLEDEVIYLGTHAAQHLLQRLSWVFDLKLILAAHPELDWAEVLASARHAGVQTPLYTALRALVRGLGGTQVPAYVLEALRPSWVQARVIDEVFSEQRLVYSVATTTKWRTYATLPFLASGPVRMARFVAANVKHAAQRKVAFAFPRVFPARWRG